MRVSWLIISAAKYAVKKTATDLLSFLEKVFLSYGV